MAGRKKKRGKWKYLNISRTKKAFLDVIKNIFHSFLRAIICWKVNVWWKIADASFNFSDSPLSLRGRYLKFTLPPLFELSSVTTFLACFNLSVSGVYWKVIHTETDLQLKPAGLFKGYSRCKTITSENVPCEAHVKNFFVWEES